MSQVGYNNKIMGHLRNKYSSNYFLGGVDQDTGKPYGVLGHEDFCEDRIHERLAKEFDFTLSLIGSLSGINVLDIGIGRGDRIPLFLKESVASYTGLDFSFSAIEIVREKYKDRRIKLLHMDAIQITDERAFDLITMYDVVEHIPTFDMEIVWSKISRALRPGGYVVFSTPIFENPNVADHTEQIPSVCGIHCNKQTLDTLMRTFLRHDFTLARREDRIFGLVRTEDLPVFTTSTREIYVKENESLFEQKGISDFNSVLSEEVFRALVPGAGRVVLGCVTENRPKYLTQALRLLQSIRWFGGLMSGVNFFVCFVESIDESYAQEFERLGAFLRKVKRFSNNHPHSNKLSFFDLPEIKVYDTIMLLDCDTIIVQDPWPFLDGQNLQAKIVDLPTISHGIFVRLFNYFDLPVPPEKYRCTYDGSPTIWYCNSGVLVFPSKMLSSFVPIWREYNTRLSNNIDLLSPHQNYCDQASLSLAFAAHPVPFQELSVSMNFPLHLAAPKAPPSMIECDPVILHYHDKVDTSGYLLPSLYQKAQDRIQLINTNIRETRKKNFNNQLFWDFRYSQYPELGSGIGSRGDVLDYKKSILREFINELKPSSVLDVGCGDCALTEGLLLNSYTGVDVSQVVVRRNQLKMPWRKFVYGDFLNLELGEVDLVLCFDVLIHLSDPKSYQSFVEHLVSRTGQHGLVSGYEDTPIENGDIVFYHEPLSTTINRYNVHAVRKVGQYRNVVVWYYKKAYSKLSDTIVSNPTASLHAPVFLVGSMRSGTTLLADLLGTFFGIIHCPFELKDIWSSVGHVPMASPRTRDTACYQMGADDVRPGQAEKLSTAFLKRMQQNSEGKREDAIFLNKNPHLCNKLPFVNTLFPDARFIWIHRPLPHVVVSLRRLFEDVLKRQETWHYWPELEKGTTERCWQAFHQKEAPAGFDHQRLFPGGDIKHIAEYWLESNRAVAKFFLTLPNERHLEIDEEDLVNDPQKQIDRCLSFLNQQEEISPGIYKNLDPSRNDQWKSLISDEDRKKLENFVETNIDKIKNIFPSQNYVGLSTPKTLSASQYIANKPKRISPQNLQKQKRQPLCITGMHRSGTSMVARLLNVCGLYLGEEKELIGPQPDNPEGFWENSQFVNLNTEILLKLGGDWDLPPEPEKGWERQPKFKSLSKKGSSLIQRFEPHHFWGWKDPRSSLTAPFWNMLIKDLKFIISVRHPLEVAGSLQQRGYNSQSFSLNLWNIYNQQLLSGTRRQQRIITHYDSYFKDPKNELKRIFDFLNMDISEELLDRACDTIKNSLKHHKIQSSSEKLPPKTIKLYKKLYLDAGPVYDQGEVSSPAILPEVSQKSAGSFAAVTLYDSQIAAFENLLKLRPDDTSVLNMLGELYLKKGDKEKALHCYEKLVGLSPEDVDAMKELADLYKNEFARPQEAYTIYRKLLEQNPDDEEVRQEVDQLAKLLGKAEDIINIDHDINSMGGEKITKKSETQEPNILATAASSGEKVIQQPEEATHPQKIDGPILVYNMGKVGSRSIYETLADMKIGVPLYHAHVLDNLDNMANSIRKRFSNPINSLAVIKQGKELRQLIDGNLEQRWYLITPVREPIARNVSRFFHSIEEVIPDIRQQLEAGHISVNDLFDAYLKKWEHSSAINWFDWQFKPVFNIDVYSKPFPANKGFDIMHNGRFSVLLIRLENLDSCAEQALHEFLGLPNLKLKKSNLGVEKWYKELYRQFTSQIQLPNEYLDEMYNSKYSQHFYSPEEIKSFRSKWTQQLQTV